MTWCMEPEYERKLRELREEFGKYKASTDARIAELESVLRALTMRVR